MITPDVVFNIGNAAILPAWALMIFAPQWSYTRLFINSYGVVLLLAVMYAVIAFTNIDAISQADFMSLQGIKTLFLSAVKSDYFVVAAWFHYLAFDLLVGTHIYNTAQRQKIPHIWIVPCLVGTFVLGPVGFLLFYIVTSVIRPSTKEI